VPGRKIQKPERMLGNIAPDDPIFKSRQWVALHAFVIGFWVILGFFEDVDEFLVGQWDVA